MKRYIVVTNIWGKKRNIFGNLVEHFDEEREYFDTMKEVDEYVGLFESVCENIKIPKKDWNGNYSSGPSFHFTDETERLWGYVIGDTTTSEIIRWGGYDLKNISRDAKRTFSHYGVKLDGKFNKLIAKDYLFRGNDEIPKDYKWDNGEYEGWLQFRWGDGKNAIDYVEEKKPKHIEDIAEDHSEAYEQIYKDMEERAKWREEHPTEFAEQLEDAFKKYEEREKMKILENRW